MANSIRNKKCQFSVSCLIKRKCSLWRWWWSDCALCLCHDLVWCSTAVWFNLCEDKTTKSRIWQHKLLNQREVDLQPKAESLYKVWIHGGMRYLCFIDWCHCDGLHSSESFHSLQLDRKVYHTLLDNGEMNVSQLPADTVNKGHAFN